jgi:hypothetical protein
MCSLALRSAGGTARLGEGEPVRVAFLGAVAWLDGCAPPRPTAGLSPRQFTLEPGRPAGATIAELSAFRPHVSVVFDPLAAAPDLLAALPRPSLGLLVGEQPPGSSAVALDALDRIASFRPALTGEAAGSAQIWRAVPPPINDRLFGEVRPLHRKARAMSIGRSTPHREAMLLPAKHHHDLLELVHGVTGDALVSFLRAYDVGVYVAPTSGGGFGAQVGMHLAAGQLLLADVLAPTHGLERNIDYLHISSPTELEWMLARLKRFPEMHQRVRVRGRLKAEQYRSSRVFARLVHDLVADVATFGGGPLA